MALKLLFSCGVTMPWEDQYRDYLRDYQPEYFYKVEQRAFLPKYFFGMPNRVMTALPNLYMDF